jgi:hypothetical protein
MTTATATTAQKVNSVLRSAGVPRSEETNSSRIAGFWTRDYGYSVEVHGVTTYKCSFCKKGSGHLADCISVTHRAHVKYHQRKVNDGTFTIRLHQRTTIANAPEAARSDADRAAIVNALTQAGLTVEHVNADEWFVR